MFRIGINVGDVLVENDDLLGDGVNIAARLEALADPGGVCISDAVQKQLAGKTDFACEDPGERTLRTSHSRFASGAGSRDHHRLPQVRPYRCPTGAVHCNLPFEQSQRLARGDILQRRHHRGQADGRFPPSRSLCAKDEGRVAGNDEERPEARHTAHDLLLVRPTTRVTSVTRSSGSMRTVNRPGLQTLLAFVQARSSRCSEPLPAATAAAPDFFNFFRVLIQIKAGFEPATDD